MGNPITLVLFFIYGLAPFLLFPEFPIFPVLLLILTPFFLISSNATIPHLNGLDPTDLWIHQNTCGRLSYPITYPLQL